jgi:hypothetical protein
VTAAEDYAARVRAVNAQRARLKGAPYAPSRWDSVADSYRFDPHRPLDANLAAIAEYLRPDDDLVDVGGGAGRIGLPLALRCRSLTNVEPSPGMGRAFRAVADEAGITNASLVTADWLSADGVTGDIVLSVDAAYFVENMAAFIRRLDAAARRRVIVSLWVVPPPNRHAALFRATFGEDQVLVPGHEEVLAVAREAGIAPEVRLLPDGFSWPGDETLPATREAAIEFALETLEPADRATAAARLDAQFDDLFMRAGDRYEPLWVHDGVGVLVTWEPGRPGEPRASARGR